MLTYNDIYEALRKEKYNEQLQPLEKNFIKEVASYLNERKNMKRQLENAVSIFRELMLRRRKKLLNLVFIARETGISKRDFDNMLDFEKEMFDKIIKSMEESDKKMNDSLTGKQEKSENILILFKENVEEFMGLNGEMLGPFDKGEMANLPEKISKILIEGEKAEAVEE